MRPISDINIGDQYQKSYPYNLIWSVFEVDNKEKMIKLQSFDNNNMPISRPLWKKNTDNLFNTRIFNGKTNKVENL